MIEIIKKAVISLFREEEGILAVYLLGSAARNELRPGSDIDIAVLPVMGEKLLSRRRIELANELSYKLSRTVDIGEISSLNLIYASEVFSTGICLYSTNQEKADLYRASLLGMYVNFNYERREVLDAYRT